MTEARNPTGNRRAGVDTLMNLLRILFLLRSARFKQVEGWPGHQYAALTALQLQELLGADVTVNTVKGWLRKLSQDDYVEALLCPGRETHWMLHKDSPMHDLNIGEVDAVTKLIAQSDVLGSIPSAMRAELQGLKRLAEKKLDNMALFGGTGTRMPLERLTILRRGQIESPPGVRDDVMDAVYDALWLKKMLRITYHSSQRQQAELPAEVFESSPIRLVQHRDGRLYLLVPAADVPSPDPGSSLPFKSLALHRIVAAERLDQALAYDSDIDAAAKTMDGFGYRRHITLVANIAKRFAFRLEESPINDSQRLTASDSAELPVRLEVAVAWTWDLEWWLRSTGADVEILEPADLRREIAESLHKAASRYPAN